VFIVEFWGMAAQPGEEIPFIRSTSCAPCSGSISKRGLNIRTVAVGHRQRSQRREMIAHRNGRANKGVGIRTVGVRQRDENFAKHRAIGLRHDAHAPYAGRITADLRSGLILQTAANPQPHRIAG
jgi:hypothetical protein